MGLFTSGGQRRPITAGRKCAGKTIPVEVRQLGGGGIQFDSLLFIIFLVWWCVFREKGWLQLLFVFWLPGNRLDRVRSRAAVLTSKEIVRTGQRGHKSRASFAGCKCELPLPEYHRRLRKPPLVYPEWSKSVLGKREVQARKIGIDSMEHVPEEEGQCLLHESLDWQRE